MTYLTHIKKAAPVHKRHDETSDLGACSPFRNEHGACTLLAVGLIHHCLSSPYIRLPRDNPPRWSRVLSESVLPASNRAAPLHP